MQAGAHVRFADWTPDAPAAGFSFCLAPRGTSTWMGPFLPQGLPFPGTGAAYADVPPGDYEVQVVVATPSSDCTTGVIPASYGLPMFADGTYATIATIGNMMPTGGDASMKVAAFLDDVSGTAAGLKLRAINASSRVGYAEVGTGSQAAGNFSVLFPDVAFGSAAATVDGGTTDSNGYALLAPLSGAELSAYPIVGDSSQSVTASQVSLGAGIAATLVVVGAEDNGGLPAQIIICNDVAAAGGAASPCTSYSQ